MSGMNGNRKQYAAFDHAVADVIDELRGATSGRELARLSGIGHNRMATILRRDTPPPTPGELAMIAAVFDTSASAMLAKAERSAYMLAAREADDDGEAEAGQIDP